MTVTEIIEQLCHVADDMEELSPPPVHAARGQEHFIELAGTAVAEAIAHLTTWRYRVEHPNDDIFHTGNCALKRLTGTPRLDACDCGVYERWVQKQRSEG